MAVKHYKNKAGRDKPRPKWVDAKKTGITDSASHLPSEHYSQRCTDTPKCWAGIGMRPVNRGDGGYDQCCSVDGKTDQQDVDNALHLPSH